MNYNWDWTFWLQPSITGEGTYASLLAQGIAWTALISLLSWALALIAGTMAGIMRSRPPGVLQWLTTLLVHVFRNIPLLVQLFLWYFLFPELLPASWGDALKNMNPQGNQFLSIVLCLTCYTAAGVAEQVNAGLRALPCEQMAAAKALGLNAQDCYRLILLPQALRIIAPSLSSDFMNVFKNSSAALTIGLMELTGQARQIAEFSGQPLEAYLLATAVYMLISYTVILLMRRLDSGAKPHDPLKSERYLG
jgi:glutamate/aspartate transport system permease protein